MDIHLSALVPYFLFKSSIHCDLTSGCYHFTEVLLKCTDSFLPAKSTGRFSFLIFLDFSAARDNVNPIFSHISDCFSSSFEFTPSLFIPYMVITQKRSTDHTKTVLCMQCENIHTFPASFGGRDITCQQERAIYKNIYLIN